MRRKERRILRLALACSLRMTEERPGADSPGTPSVSRLAGDRRRHLPLHRGGKGVVRIGTGMDLKLGRCARAVEDAGPYGGDGEAVRIRLGCAPVSQ